MPVQTAGMGQLTPDPVPLPLRLLLIVAAPDDQHELDTEEEIGVLQEALHDALRQRRVEVAYVDDATLENIGAKIRAFNPHIIHYTGHGKYDPQQARSYLALEDDLGQTRPAGIEALRPHLSAAADLRLIDPANLTGLGDLSGFSAPAALIDVDGLPLPRHFVGRKPELRLLRRALRDDKLKAVFVRGIGGLGKSSLAGRLIARPGTPLDGVLTIRCHEVDPLDILGKLTSFLQGQGQPGHAEAGALLLDSRLDPAERAAVPGTTPTTHSPYGRDRRATILAITN